MGASSDPYQRERGYELVPVGGDRYRLRLFGAFRRTWADGLCQGLRTARVNVVQGHALREPGSAGPAGAQAPSSGAWRARFELERTPGGTDPMLLDLLSLCDRIPPPRAPGELRIDRFTLDRHPESDGLRLCVEAPDRVGLLAALLERFSFLALVAEEMTIETVDGGVRDRFVLRESRGQAPAAATERALAGVLRGELCRSAA